MNITVGCIPYLNMAPFYLNFGVETIHEGDITIKFKRYTPRDLGRAARAGEVDAGALSLVDTFQLEDSFEALGPYGIGVKRTTGSVLLFSRQPMRELSGMCSVTEESSTSFRLLQVLLEKKYGRNAVSYGRVASGVTFDGDSDALLLIGDDALRARKQGVKGLPLITDLATEWYDWQGVPFVFARWVVRKTLPETAKKLLYKHLDNSLNTSILIRNEMASNYTKEAGLTPAELTAYWEGFLYKLTPEHQLAIARFKELAESVCLTV